ncbi:RHS repeat-associated core domain-containing protein [Pseudomonas sp. SbOxS1]|uniref:RHS repeat-associated core domain-containing protein n=1 Tax=Pseudomonas sp. SbOxS1 TaxID=2723884 RepID=UPI00211F3C27|nr:RHS repeat-associated core domain-containing protein [Pseudomonas sp. SbOxS1]
MAYTAYGHLSSERIPSTCLGFNGEIIEPHTRWYLLGNGHRAYNPVLMRFHSSDKLSPFGAGGLNSYMYCVADPVNHRDPSGRVIETVIVSQLLGVGGGASSLGGMALSLSTSARFSGKGVLALGTGAGGMLLGAAAFANSAPVIAPVLAGAGFIAGVATVKLAYEVAKTATTRGTQWFQSVARVIDRPPRYSTLSLRDTPPPSFATAIFGPPPAYSPSRAPTPMAATHSTARNVSPQTAPLVQNASLARDPEHFLNRPELHRAQMGELPQVQIIVETSKRIRRSPT